MIPAPPSVRRRHPLAALAVVAALACQSRPAFVPPRDTPEACRDRQSKLGLFVGALPDRSVSAALRIETPESTLGRPIGDGPIVELARDAVYVDGAALSGATEGERVRAFSEWATAWAGSAPSRPVVYMAATGVTTVQTLRAYVVNVPAGVELRLLLRTHTREARSDESSRGDAVAEKLFLEPNPEKRRRIALAGYDELSDCPEVMAAARSVDGVDSRKRWPALHAALSAALPKCRCSDLDAAGLAALIGAEQRAGAASLGWVPLSFVRDERCEASMPLRSVEKLVRQIEAFDEEFSGGWQKDALTFGDVVEGDRLRVYFCDALPGETLAAKERARATVYFRTSSSASCEAFRFEPLAPGSPMGTFRRATASRPPLSFHYWQAAEEIRVFGPIDPTTPSLPTDSRDWACDQTVRLAGVDDDGLKLEEGRWYYGEAACKGAKDADLFGGCVAARATSGP